MIRRVLGMLVLVGLLGAAPASAADWTVPDEAVVIQQVAPDLPESWVVEASPFLRVYAEAGDAAEAARLARHGTKSVQALAARLGVPVGDTIHVVLAPDEARFRDLQPGRSPTWADGVAWPASGQIFLKAPRLRADQQTRLEVVLDHELTHVLLGRAFAPQRVPTWLQEGTAQVLAGEFGPQTTQKLSEGMAVEGLLSLDSLTSKFPDNPHRAQLAYAQSADFIGWIVKEHGEDSLRTLVKSLVHGDDVRGAMREATGQDLDVVDAAWRARYESGTAFSFAALADSPIWWALGAGALIGAGLLRRRRFNQRLAEMAERERREAELLEAVLSGPQGRDWGNRRPDAFGDTWVH